VTRESQGDRATGSGAYALNALGEPERAEFEAELAESEALRNEATELGDTAVLLGLAVDPVEPSAGLKAAIMDRLSSTPQLPREVVERLEQRPTSPEERARIRWFERPVIVLTAVAAAIAIVAGAGTIAAVVQQGTSRQQQADALAAINASDDLKHASAAVASGGTATLVWSAGLGRSALIVKGLDALPGDKTYELWYIDAKGTPTPAGLFEATSASTWRVLDGTMAAGDTVGVTVEPSGGSPAPTTKPIVAIASS
jgi:anti-sigma-K factor RskA